LWFQSTLPYAVAIFLGAFLLFQVELIIAKYILPWFGGAPAVWTTCMLVFQVLLLAGYVYAHLLATRMRLSAQAVTHLCLMGFSVVLLAGLAFLWPSPITPGSNWKPVGSAEPVWHIVSLLTVSIGAPFFLLAATSPLLQSWFAQTRDRSPYRLFALSNLGSLLGLLSYPFMLEPHLTLNRQAWVWAAGYVVYSLITAACAALALRGEPTTARRLASTSPKPVSEEARPGLVKYLMWFFLAACGCVMFLATTNMVCQEIAVIPFLWVLPLSLYLLTFIACFDSNWWYRRGIFHPLFFVSLVLVLITQKAPVLPQIGSYSLALFVVCMICHGELARLKPASRYLTSFYLMIAGGGAAGGVFVALIAPNIFPAFWEFQFAIFGCGILLALVLFRDRDSWFYRGSPWLACIMVLGVAAAIETSRLLFPDFALLQKLRVYYLVFLGAAGLLAVWSALKPDKFQRRFRLSQAYALGVLALMGIACVMQVQYPLKGVYARFRSFFGAFRIEQNGSNLVLLHGRALHGWQIRDGVRDPTPTAYYATNTGIGIMLWNHPKRRLSLSVPESDLRVGVIGLGAGTLAAYGRPGDYYCFYEIDPAIARIAQGPQAIFTFLKNSAAIVEVVLGDGRLSLERQAVQGNLRKYDVLILDAFSSDSIPVHLLTREAMQLYLSHLRGPDSVVAFHISNRILDLRPVLRGLSREFNLALIIVHSRTGKVTAGTTWGLLSRNPQVFEIPELRSAAAAYRKSGDSTVLWTDDYSNLLDLVQKNAWW